MELTEAESNFNDLFSEYCDTSAWYWSNEDEEYGEEEDQNWFIN